MNVATLALSFSNVLVLLLHISDRTETPHTLSTKIHSNKSEPNNSLKYSPIQNEAKRDKSGGKKNYLKPHHNEVFLLYGTEQGEQDDFIEHWTWAFRPFNGQRKPFHTRDRELVEETKGCVIHSKRSC